MTQERDPLLHPVLIEELRPTQMTVGLREVKRKSDEWIAHCKLHGYDRNWLGGHMLPAVLGPKKRPWIIDNHHLARALHDEGVPRVLIRIVADLSHLKERLFRTFMDNRNWLHPYDGDGHRQPSDEIPHHIGELQDDPYRSLAGALRRAGGYAKTDTPFSEFLWADFLRARLEPELLDKDFNHAVEKALKLARKKHASYLPGFAGPHED